MQTTRPDQAEGLGRAASGRWNRGLGLLALSLCAILSEGCASFGGGGGGLGSGCGSTGCGTTGFGKCGGLLSKCNLGQKFFHRRGAVATDACEPGLGAMPVDSGGMMVPSGPVLQAPPPGDAEPNILPNNGSMKDPATGAKNGAVKSLYQAQMNGSRGEAPWPAARSPQPRRSIPWPTSRAWPHPTGPRNRPRRLPRPRRRPGTVPRPRRPPTPRRSPPRSRRASAPGFAASATSSRDWPSAVSRPNPAGNGSRNSATRR